MSTVLQILNLAFTYFNALGYVAGLKATPASTMSRKPLGSNISRLSYLYAFRVRTSLIHSVGDVICYGRNRG